jgi:hypothetical protein
VRGLPNFQSKKPAQNNKIAKACKWGYLNKQQDIFPNLSKYIYLTKRASCYI